MTSDETKPVRHCPFCGSADLKLVTEVPRCLACRTVFMVSYQRALRKAPSRATKGGQ